MSVTGARLRNVTTAPSSNDFAVYHAHVRNDVTIAYVREGIGGTPLLLLHGYPETKRIWWRNIAALAANGFEVIAPDFRGHGDSSMAPDDFYDIAAYSAATSVAGADSPSWRRACSRRTSMGLRTPSTS